jgi:hypothetical protein
MWTKTSIQGIRYVSEMATVNDDETINTMFTGVVDVTEDEDGIRSVTQV